MTWEDVVAMGQRAAGRLAQGSDDAPSSTSASKPVQGSRPWAVSGEGMRASLCVLALVLVAAPGARAAAPSADASVHETSDAPPQAVVRPHWRKIPSGDEMARFYPENAMRRGVSGKVVMSCKVAREGTLYACAILSETPPDAGFGAAALKLAPYFEMTPQMADGQPVDGAVVRIPVRFNIDGASQAPGRGGSSVMSGLGRWLLALIFGFIAILQSII